MCHSAEVEANVVTKAVVPDRHVETTCHCAQYDSSISLVVVLARPPRKILPGTNAVPPMPGGGPLPGRPLPLYCCWPYDCCPWPPSGPGLPPGQVICRYAGR